MLVIDAEMSGLDPRKNSIVSIGAVDFDDPTRQFYGECRVWDGAELVPESLAVCGFNEEELFDPAKKPFIVLAKEFYNWVAVAPERTLAGQNVSLDREFLNDAFRRAGVEFRFAHRNLDTHSVAYAYFRSRGVTIPLKETDQQSALSLDKILEMLGIPPEPKPHIALNGAKLEAEALSRMMFGKNLLPEFEIYPVS
ncbi:MAG: 3'-5' exonuclease [Minisyncoccota bacterium]